MKAFVSFLFMLLPLVNTAQTADTLFWPLLDAAHDATRLSRTLRETLDDINRVKQRDKFDREYIFALIDSIEQAFIVVEDEIARTLIFERNDSLILDPTMIYECQEIGLVNMEAMRELLDEYREDLDDFFEGHIPQGWVYSPIEKPPSKIYSLMHDGVLFHEYFEDIVGYRHHE